MCNLVRHFPARIPVWAGSPGDVTGWSRPCARCTRGPAAGESRADWGGEREGRGGPPCGRSDLWCKGGGGGPLLLPRRTSQACCTQSIKQPGAGAREGASRIKPAEEEEEAAEGAPSGLPRHGFSKGNPQPATAWLQSTRGDTQVVQKKHFASGGQGGALPTHSQLHLSSLLQRKATGWPLTKAQESHERLKVNTKSR